MLTSDNDNQDPRYERNKLESLKAELSKREKDVIRLKAAVEFLEVNPGAVALINSL